MSGDEVAARAQRRGPYASSRDPYVTGSLGRAHAKRDRVNEEDEFADE